ncbi:MAG: hypothetical protein K1X31_02110 [Gemmatimonadaceae bacterium]|nr:hypothetical protein [Gemmatimonadaceae bacterium]
MPDFTLPEFTRSLRALAVPSAPGSDHDRVFKPLIAARTAAHKVQGVDAQVAAFDAGRLEREWREAIAALAASRHAGSAPDRRALEAELDTLAAPLWAQLKAMQAAGQRARAAAAPERESAWTAWVTAVQRVFDAADDWWRAALPVLADPRGRQGSLWRRVLRRSP